jgi:hypothetical protein
MGLNFDQLFPSRFLKAGEMEGNPLTLTIADVALEALESEDGTEKDVAIITFKEPKAKQLRLNRTNGESVRAMFGSEIDDWIGKRVTFYPERDTSGMSESGVCIRVKGSPDIPAPITATIKLPRRRPITRKLEVTGGGGVCEAPQTRPTVPVADPVPADYEVEVHAAESFYVDAANDLPKQKADLALATMENNRKKAADTDGWIGYLTWLDKATNQISKELKQKQGQGELV